MAYHFLSPHNLGVITLRKFQRYNKWWTGEDKACLNAHICIQWTRGFFLVPPAKLERSSEAAGHSTTVSILAPRTKGHHNSGGIVLRSKVHRLVGNKPRCLARGVAAVYGINDFLVRHGAVDTIGCEDDKCVLPMLHLQKPTARAQVGCNRNEKQDISVYLDTRDSHCSLPTPPIIRTRHVGRHVGRHVLQWTFTGKLFQDLSNNSW